jgi:IclR family transcriptional regulator, pca regulon regulatory protein
MVRLEHVGALSEHPAMTRRPVEMTPLAAVPPAERETDFVQSLQRGLAVIRAFDADHPTLTLSDVARSTGLARAAARRFLLTLVDLGYIRVDGRQFRLSPRVLELGRAYLSSLTLPEIALPHLREQTEELRESSSLAVLDGTEIVYVAHAPAKRILSVSIDIGTRDVAFATSLGRVLLAGQDDDWLEHYLSHVRLPAITPRTISSPAKLRTELQRIRRQGWALVDQELEDGLRAVAAPIHDEHGHVIAAANLAVHASRWSNDAIRTTLLPRLLHTTTAIDRDANAAATAPGLPPGSRNEGGSG